MSSPAAPMSPTQLLAKDASTKTAAAAATKLQGDAAAAARAADYKKPETAAFNSVNYWGHRGVDASLVPDDA
eukprot:CAMPEP_0198678132 /NCGR_PEP_ID=MMETSP1468-20131203/191_1 /TAXON_ID=1461545 /ORGANISM="Mantoniella sp, Strain CCMP1436" /LENGTH=71 /DNA_ID=CAMNT_0044415095 /DNA_START=53 /DNA_END=268 /DNA_ORIENTATION=-